MSLAPPSFNSGRFSFSPQKTNNFSQNPCSSSPPAASPSLPIVARPLERAFLAHFLHFLTSCSQGWTWPRLGHQQPPTGRPGGHWLALIHPAASAWGSFLPPTCPLTRRIPSSPLPLASRPCSGSPPFPWDLLRLLSRSPSAFTGTSVNIGFLRTQPQTCFISCALTSSPVLWPQLPSGSHPPKAVSSDQAFPLRPRLQRLNPPWMSWSYCNLIV